MAQEIGFAISQQRYHKEFEKQFAISHTKWQAVGQVPNGSSKPNPVTDKGENEQA